jgi:hypothetical protein
MKKLLLIAFVTLTLAAVGGLESRAGGLRYQHGYYRPSSGTWVQGHFKTNPDAYKWNNRREQYGW